VQLVLPQLRLGASASSSSTGYGHHILNSTVELSILDPTISAIQQLTHIGHVHPIYNPYFQLIFSAEQCFSLTPNQPTVFSAQHSRTGP
jgi:hypothetical protein